MNDPMTLSVSQIASALQADRKTVSKRLAAIGAKPAGMRAGYAVYGLRAIVEAMTAATRHQDPDLMGAFERRAWVASERDRLRLEIERGNQITRKRFEDAVFGVVKIMVRGLVTLGDRLERDKRVKGDVLEYLENAIGELRDELAAAVEANARNGPSMTTSDQWRADFHQHYRDALVALCADADARMVASP